MTTVQTFKWLSIGGVVGFLAGVVFAVHEYETGRVEPDWATVADDDAGGEDGEVDA